MGKCSQRTWPWPGGAPTSFDAKFQRYSGNQINININIKRGILLTYSRHKTPSGLRGEQDSFLSLFEGPSQPFHRKTSQERKRNTMARLSLPRHATTPPESRPETERQEKPPEAISSHQRFTHVCTPHARTQRASVSGIGISLPCIPYSTRHENAHV